MTHRGVLVGCGFFAENHLHAWAEMPDVEIVAVCDHDEAKAQAMASRFSINKHYSDAAAMVAAEAPDFVDIATTVASHRALVEIAAPHARLLISQKPMANSLADARAMVHAADQAGATLLVHENFRWQRPFQEIARRIAAGELGDVHFARFSFRHGYDNYVNQPYLAEIERFALMDVGLHLFDLARHLVGEASVLCCRTHRLNPAVKGEDAFTALVGHTGGATSVLDCSFFTKLSPHRFPQTTAWVEGARGTIDLGEDYRMTVHSSGGRKTYDVEPPVPSWGKKPWHIIEDSVAAFQRHAIAVLEGKASPQPSGADSLARSTLSMPPGAASWAILMTLRPVSAACGKAGMRRWRVFPSRLMPTAIPRSAKPFAVKRR